MIWYLDFMVIVLTGLGMVAIHGVGFFILNMFYRETQETGVRSAIEDAIEDDTKLPVFKRLRSVFYEALRSFPRLVSRRR